MTLRPLARIMLASSVTIAACRTAEAPPVAAPSPALASNVVDSAAIDSTAAALMAREGVQGLAVAVIDRGQVVFVSAYGFRNVERRLPLTPATVMYLSLIHISEPTRPY